MPDRGSNLPGFRDVQLAFAANIRNPEVSGAPAGIEPRRMKIYQDLFYNNIENFLATSFPVAKQVLGHERWHALAREFLHTHPSESPYFLEISQEFLTFLGEYRGAGLPGFLLELCHYEWVELALSVSDTELPQEGFDPDGDILDRHVYVSPLIWCLAYQWPVHEIGAEHVPERKPDATTELIVCRRRDDQVRFMVVNPATLRLIELLQGGSTGREALRQLAGELNGVEYERVHGQGVATMERLRDAEIILGARLDA